MIMASNLPGFENYPIAEKLSTKFNKPVFLDNDANVAGLAEAVLELVRIIQLVIM